MTKKTTTSEVQTKLTNGVAKVVQTLLTIPTTWKAVAGAKWPTILIPLVSFLRNRIPIASRESHLAASPTTGEVIKADCEKRRIAVASRLLPCGDHADASLHEIPLEATTGDVLLYFHGGGYRNIIASGAHVPLAVTCARAAGASTLAILEYSLTPAGKYPTQLAQAARALQSLLDRQIRPGQILIAGDSAGGNLALGLLAHVKQPHPAIPAISGVSDEAKLKGVLLISPWVTNPVTAASFGENAHKDYISAAGMEMFVDFWSPSDDVWADPLRAGARFWSSVPARKMIVTVGSFESFRDDVVALSRLLEQAMGDRLTLIVAPGEVHVHPVINTAMSSPPGKSLVALLEWFRNL